MIKTAIFILAVLFISGCVAEDSNNGALTSHCSTDSDCVAATCCHASSCVIKDMAPDCSGVMCTEECRPGTMDCGEGHCGCIENNCVVIGN
ncbi:MAG: hypothetical protein KAI53_05025 [Candidatus Aenigmarchaeota archaeon]|nr:hypothetical protein [Candidatus Aenigmarchaeota archaeon]